MFDGRGGILGDHHAFLAGVQANPGKTMVEDGVFFIKGLEQLTGEEFFHFCQQNRDLRIERTREGEIIIMSPTGAKTGWRNSEINFQLQAWNRKRKTGVVFDSSTGFDLPEGGERSPDASWVPRAEWEALSDAEQQRFAPLCPAFVIELKSPSDVIKTLRQKMHIWIENGCQLAWLINPEDETVGIYRADGSQDTVQGFDHPVSGEDVLPGFVLDLSVLR